MPKAIYTLPKIIVRKIGTNEQFELEKEEPTISARASHRRISIENKFALKFNEKMDKKELPYFTFVLREMLNQDCNVSYYGNQYIVTMIGSGYIYENGTRRHIKMNGEFSKFFTPPDNYKKDRTKTSTSFIGAIIQNKKDKNKITEYFGGNQFANSGNILGIYCSLIDDKYNYGDTIDLRFRNFVKQQILDDKYDEEFVFEYQNVSMRPHGDFQIISPQGIDEYKFFEGNLICMNGEYLVDKSKLTRKFIPTIELSSENIHGDPMFPCKNTIDNSIDKEIATIMSKQVLQSDKEEPAFKINKTEAIDPMDLDSIVRNTIQKYHHNFINNPNKENFEILMKSKEYLKTLNSETITKMYFEISDSFLKSFMKT